MRGRLWITLGALAERDHLARCAVDQRTEVILPQRQGVAHLALVVRAIVDARRTGAVAAVVVEHGLDDVRRDANVGHPGGGAAPQIMDGKIRNAAALIERTLALGPGGKA